MIAKELLWVGWSPRPCGRCRNRPRLCRERLDHSERRRRERVALATNDDVLNDEASELTPVQYFLVGVPAFINAVIDQITGVLTFTATQSGFI